MMNEQILLYILPVNEQELEWSEKVGFYEKLREPLYPLRIIIMKHKWHRLPASEHVRWVVIIMQRYLINFSH